MTRGLLHPRNLAIRLVAMDSRELTMDQPYSGASAFPVRLDVRPRARPRRVWEGNRNGVVARERGSDAALEVGDAEQLLDGERADRDDQRGPDQPQLPLPPEGAELLFLALWLPVAAFRVSAGVAARDRSAVEGRVELVLVDPEPAP